MKILYIANARIPTEKAHGIQIMQTVQELAKSKISKNDVDLVVPKRINQNKEDPFEYYGIEKNFKMTKLPCLDMILLDKYLGPAVLWLEAATFFISAFFYVLFQKADVIYTRDKFSLPLSLFKKNLFFEAHTFPKNYFLYARFFERLKGIIVITRKLKESFIGKGLPPDKILVAPDGADLAKFQIPNSKFQIREKLGLPQDKKIVLYTGHLYAWKGVQVLADASRYLPNNAEVYFVGGTKEDVKRFKVKCLKFKNARIIGHKSHSEIPYWLKAADVLVLPNSAKEEISRYWTSPMKMFEYMASKRPIIASDLPSIREILNENNAILVEPDNSEALARGIEKALKDSDLSAKISMKAFTDVQNYTWEKRAKRILDFL